MASYVQVLKNATHEMESNGLIKVLNKQYYFKTEFLEAKINNILISILTIAIRGLKVDKILNEKLEFEACKNRGNVIKTNLKKLDIIDCSYNASPDSVRANSCYFKSLISILAKQELFFSTISTFCILETLSVILQVAYFKISKGKRIFKMAPLHHHFEKNGVQESKITSRAGIFSVIVSFFRL